MGVKALATLVPHHELVLVVRASELSNLFFLDLVDDSAQVVGFVGRDAVIETIQLLQRDKHSRGLDEITSGGFFFIEQVDVRSLSDESVLLFRVHPMVSHVILELVATLL